jgi:hypothetical protein
MGMVVLVGVNLKNFRGNHMKRTKLTMLFIFSATMFTVGTNTNVYAMNSALPGEKLVPTVTKLDFDKIRLLVDTQPQYIEQLMSLGVRKLTGAGLYTKSRDTVSRSEEIGFLKLILNPIPLGVECQEKVMYETRLELWEDVSPLRNQELRLQAVTWSYGISHPIMKDQVPLEQLESDLDQFLTEFIRAYRMGNPAK